MASIAQLFLVKAVSADRLLAAAQQDSLLIEHLHKQHMPVADFVTDWIESLEDLLDADLEDVLIHGITPLMAGRYEELDVTFMPALDWRDQGKVVMESRTRARLSLVNVDGGVAQKSGGMMDFGTARNWRARLVLALETRKNQRYVDYFWAQQMLHLPQRLHL